jgi:hypothetical protein
MASNVVYSMPDRPQIIGDSQPRGHPLVVSVVKVSRTKTPTLELSNYYSNTAKIGKIARNTTNKC